jgi:flagellar biosynthetic protein FliR
VNSLISHLGENQLAGFMLVLARVAPLFLLAPLFSSRMFPARVRGVAAVALALGLAPIALHGQQIPLDALALGGLLLKEMLVGTAFAFTVGALFAAVTVAGSFLDVMVGFSFGSLVDPVSGNRDTILAQMYSMLGVLIFIAIGGDGWVVKGIARTYALIPLGRMPALGSLVSGADHAFATIFLSALELAAPVLIAVMIADVGFGVVSRVVPQLNVFAVGFPAKILVGFLMIGASMPFAAGWIDAQLQQSVRAALSSLHVG